jgi:hypothetical protein
MIYRRLAYTSIFGAVKLNIHLADEPKKRLLGKVVVVCFKDHFGSRPYGSQIPYILARIMPVDSERVVTRVMASEQIVRPWPEDAKAGERIRGA